MSRGLIGITMGFRVRAFVNEPLETHTVSLAEEGATMQTTAMWKTSVSMVLINALIVVLLASCASYTYEGVRPPDNHRHPARESCVNESGRAAVHGPFPRTRHARVRSTRSWRFDSVFHWVGRHGSPRATDVWSRHHESCNGRGLGT